MTGEKTLRFKLYKFTVFQNHHHTCFSYKDLICFIYLTHFHTPVCASHMKRMMNRESQSSELSEFAFGHTYFSKHRSVIIKCNKKQLFLNPKKLFMWTGDIKTRQTEIINFYGFQSWMRQEWPDIDGSNN